ncbi:hypothetical protein AB0F17_42805 [Nonomuraea sp. NPDC026600]|uniref:hypothetical protein n=1 Tax=Nonomuraea sp. NPDC026600 TaxID=3155363 RepID=UPI0033F4196C
MTSTTGVFVFVVHLDWGSLSDAEPVIMVAPDESNAYLRTTRFIVRNARPWLDEDVQEAYDGFLSDYPYDPDAATPEQAKAWVSAYTDSDLYPLITVEEVQVLP